MPVAANMVALNAGKSLTSRFLTPSIKHFAKRQSRAKQNTALHVCQERNGVALFTLQWDATTTGIFTEADKLAYILPRWYILVSKICNGVLGLVMRRCVAFSVSPARIFVGQIHC